MLVEALKNRLRDEVGALRSVEGAASMAALMQSNGLPQQTPAAHVVTSACKAGNEEASRGASSSPTRRFWVSSSPGGPW